MSLLAMNITRVFTKMFREGMQTQQVMKHCQHHFVRVQIGDFYIERCSALPSMAISECCNMMDRLVGDAGTTQRVLPKISTPGQ